MYYIFNDHFQMLAIVHPRADVKREQNSPIHKMWQCMQLVTSALQKAEEGTGFQNDIAKPRPV